MNESKQESSRTDGGAERESWQGDVITRLAFSALNEQRRTRRWNIFFKVLLFSYLFFILLLIYMPVERGAVSAGRHTAMVSVEGVIAADSAASADAVVTGLRRAFENKNSAGVILRINSPGGSPVQAGYVNDEIRRLRALYPDKPIYAVITDMAASGGYYVAAATDAIYADKASIVGSIGVVMNGFGFTEAMDRLGVQRRLYTAGESKGFLDPFSPVREEEVRHVRRMLETIHQQFISVVKEGRGDRLKGNEELFSGLVWTGQESIELGLVDELASSSHVAREVIGAERIVDYTPQPGYLEQFTDRLGMAMAKVLYRGAGRPELY